MEKEFIREIRASYMQLTSAQDIEDFQMKMVRNNGIDELLDITTRNVNNEIRYLYNISSMISLETAFENSQLGSEVLFALINTISSAVKIVEDYLLEIDALCLSPDMIFGKPDSNRWKLCYFSEKDTSFERDVKELFEYIIRKVKHSDVKAVTIAYGIYKRICEENFNPQELFYIEESEEQKEYEVETRQQPIESVIPDIGVEETEVEDRTKLYFVYGVAALAAVVALYLFSGIVVPEIRINDAPSSVYVGFLIMLSVGAFLGGRWFLENRNNFVTIVDRKVVVPFENKKVNIVLPKQDTTEDDDKTVILSMPSNTGNHYISWDNNRYEIKNHITTVGSMENKADCCIQKEGISRVHAKITKEDNRFFIKDMNSTNGTKVNDRELVCFELCEIRSRDKITFGDTECEFI